MKNNIELYSQFEGLGNADYDDIVEYRPELNKDVTFGPSKKYPVHNWFYYKQGFSPLLVEECLKNSKILPGSYVLDPFCGVGTTLLVAKNMGYNSIGNDILPLAMFVSKVKLRDDFNPKSIQDAVSQIGKEPLDLPKTKWPDVLVINRAFSKERQNELLVFKERILQIEDESTREILLLCLLSILGDVSKTKKDGGFLRIINNSIEKPLKIIFENKVKVVLNDIMQPSLIYSKRNDFISNVCLGDARNMQLENNSIDCIITSPPYLNKTDYTRVYSLELCLAFVNSFKELRTIRYNSFRSNVEARFPSQNILLPDSFNISLERLKSRQLSNPKHPDMIRGYFEDIALTMKEMKRVLKNEGKIYFVVWNSCFSGINFDVDVISADIGKSIGLFVERIIVARQKGTSAQQNHTYGERPLRESIVVLSKKS